ncbi:hypothetical protein PENSPDRAFT_13961 [Peniophora sp. CONT]|nr:hypothetical protein PENSPDRAFT_13961 [Peniophora sp. CONT]
MRTMDITADNLKEHSKCRPRFRWRKLPQEVLTHTFSFLVEEERPYRLRSFADGETPPSYPRLGYIRLGHVSREWRIALLDNACFWAGNIGVYPRAMHVMLARAGSTAPLTVHLPFSGGSPVESGVLELAQAFTVKEVALYQRLQTLVILNDVVPSGPQLKEVAALFHSQFPKLQELELSFLPYCPQVDQDCLKMALDTPNLQKITLSDCCFTGLWITPCLVSLHISMSSEPNTHKWITSPDHILGVIEICSASIQSIHLESLFYDVRSARDVVVSQRTGSIHLPRLTDIYVNDLAAEGAAVLSRLMYASTAQTTVLVGRCRVDSDTTAVFRSLLRAVLEKYTGHLNALRMHDDGMWNDGEYFAGVHDEFNIDLYEWPLAESTGDHRCAWYTDSRPAVVLHFERDIEMYGTDFIFYREFFTEDVIVPQLREHAYVVHKLAFALGPVNEYDGNISYSEGHIGDIVSYAMGARTVTVTEPHVDGSLVMDALCRPEGLPCLEQLCFVTRPGGENEVDCARLAAELNARASKATTGHVDKALIARDSEYTRDWVRRNLEANMGGFVW